MEWNQGSSVDWVFLEHICVSSIRLRTCPVLAQTNHSISDCCFPSMSVSCFGFRNSTNFDVSIGRGKCASQNISCDMSVIVIYTLVF